MSANYIGTPCCASMRFSLNDLYETTTGAIRPPTPPFFLVFCFPPTVATCPLNSRTLGMRQPPTDGGRPQPRVVDTLTLLTPRSTCTGTVLASPA